MNYAKFTKEEIKQRNRDNQKRYYEKYGSIILAYQKGRITKEEYKKQIAEAKRKNNVHSCVDCGKEIQTKKERCIRCENIYKGKEHIKRNPVLETDYKYSKLFSDLYASKISGENYK